MVKYCLNTETGEVRPTDGGETDNQPLPINPRGNNVLDRQLALQQQTINNNENFGFRPVEVDFNALPIELRNTDILLSK